jgi:hypothetical protein
MRDTVQMGDWPQAPSVGLANEVGRRAAKWLEDRASGRTQDRSGSNVKFTPHTEAEKAAWRARKGGGR